MLAGYLPFDDPNKTALYRKILCADYCVPKEITEDAKNLIKQILVAKPVNRTTITGIRNSVLYMSVKEKRPDCIVVGIHKIPIDKDIVSNLKEYGFNTDYALKCLECNKHNHVTTA